MIGIYKIENLINHKVYIGQSWNIHKRWTKHKSLKTNAHLNSSMEKYGKENFSFEILRTFTSHGLTQALLDSLEINYIKQYDSTNKSKGYNKKFGGEGGGLATEETKKKISEARKGKNYNTPKMIENKRKLWKDNNPSKNPMVLKKLREDKLGDKNPMWGKKPSNETIQKIIEGNRQRIKSGEHKQAVKVQCIETGEVFLTMGDAARSVTTSTGNIWYACKVPTKKCGGFHWKYFYKETILWP